MSEIATQAPFGPAGSSVLYPKDFPSLELLDLASLIKSGDIKANAKAIAKDCYVILGYGLRVTLGDPSDTDSVAMCPCPGPCNTVDEATLSPERMAEVLTNAATPVDGVVGGLGAAIPWDLILQILSLILRQVL